MDLSTPTPNEKIMATLLEIANNNNGINGRFKMAAGIVFKKQLISTGVNSLKSHPLMWKYGKNKDAIYLHAEIDAIKNSLRVIDQETLGRCDLYVVRIKQRRTGGNTCGLATPCEGCKRAIEEFNLARVFYTTDNPTVIGCVQRDVHVDSQAWTD